MSSTASSRNALVANPRLRAVAATPVPRGFVSTRTSPGSAAALVVNDLGVNESDHRKAVFWLLVVDRMSAHDRHAGRCHDVGTTSQHVGQQLERERVSRPPNHLQGGERLSTHGVDVRDRVGGGNATPVVRFIDDRRQEVDGLNEGATRPDAKNARVVRRRHADQKIRV